MSVNDFKRFLYISSSLNLTEPCFAKLLVNVHTHCKALIADKSKLNELLALLIEYSKLQANNNLDAVSFLLASLSKSARDEETSHKGND